MKTASICLTLVGLILLVVAYYDMFGEEYGTVLSLVFATPIAAVLFMKYEERNNLG